MPKYLKLVDALRLLICSLAIVSFATTSQAVDWPEGQLETLELDLAYSGIGTFITVDSDDSQTYNRLDPNSTISMTGDVQLQMHNDIGNIRAWSIYIGQCDDDDCFKFQGNSLVFGIEEAESTKGLDRLINFSIKGSDFPGWHGGIAPAPANATPIAGSICCSMQCRTW